MNADRAVTEFLGWAWRCPVCDASETGFGMEHHARTIADEHRIEHHTVVELPTLRRPKMGNNKPGTRRDLSHLDTSWQVDGACVGADPELFFPDYASDEQEAEAKAVCADCTVRVQCLDYALAAPEYYGVWGGLSETERNRIRRNRKAS